MGKLFISLMLIGLSSYSAMAKRPTTAQLKKKWDWSLPQGEKKINASVPWNKISSKGYWTWTAYQSLTDFGDTLINKAPKDITAFCPKYFSLDKHKRKVFWVNLLSSIAVRESSFNPGTANDESLFSKDLNVISRGLLQISFGSSKAKPYRNAGCNAGVAKDLVDPETNLRCGVAIFEHWAKKDKCISCKKKSGWKGAARYWSTLRTPYQVPCKVCKKGVANIGKKNVIIKELRSVKFCR